jgi:hypothetical protein
VQKSEALYHEPVPEIDEGQIGALGAASRPDFDIKLTFWLSNLRCFS